MYQMGLLPLPKAKTEPQTSLLHASSPPFLVQSVILSEVSSVSPLTRCILSTEFYFIRPRDEQIL